MVVLIALAPWLVLAASLPLLLRRRPALSSYPPGPLAEGPLVSVILPTCDDAGRVGASLATLLATTYPRYEIIVVDGGSRDGTREIVKALSARSPARIRLLDAGASPADWPWRAWACRRGFEEARGEWALFTEPGTLHDPELLPRAMSAAGSEGADLVSVTPALTMEGFWERLLMPHIWLTLTARFPSARRVNRARSPRGVVARHQYLLFRSEAYRAVGGHAVVRHGDMEDVSLAQAVVAAGRRLFLVHGEEYLETRLFRTLAGIRGGWSGALPSAARSTVAPWAERVVGWLLAVGPTALFVAPLLTFGASFLLPGWGPAGAWGAWATAVSLAFSEAIYARFRIRPAYAMAFPVGALVTSVIFAGTLLGGAGGATGITPPPPTIGRDEAASGRPG